MCGESTSCGKGDAKSVGSRSWRMRIALGCELVIEKSIQFNVCMIDERTISQFESSFIRWLRAAAARFGIWTSSRAGKPCS
jgi:hypothetical protein